MVRTSMLLKTVLCFFRENFCVWKSEIHRLEPGFAVILNLKSFHWKLLEMYTSLQVIMFPGWYRAIGANDLFCDLTGILKSFKWRDGLHLRSKGQVSFDTALTDFNSRQLKTWMKKMTAQVNFWIFFCLACNTVPKIGTLVLMKVLLTYLKIFGIHHTKTYQKTARFLLTD